MSRISSDVRKDEKKKRLNAVVNHMGGISYGLNPLDTLRIMVSSSILAEPKYYPSVTTGRSVRLSGEFNSSVLFREYDGDTEFDAMVKSVGKSLDHDFEGTLRLASELRNGCMMRLNPQLVMVLASVHRSRKEFDMKHPGLFRKINLEAMRRADEPAEQFACWLRLKGSKSGIPSILKRSWKERIEKMTKYEAAKYKNHGMGLINTVRICHAKGDVVAELMKTGAVSVADDEKTWENLKPDGFCFKEISERISMPHMALLRNLRGILSESGNGDGAYVSGVLEKLKSGVEGGRQFPFRYYSASKALSGSDVPFLPEAIDCLNECIDISTDALPKFHGRTMCLSDNSGSAWGQFTSEYGTVTVAEIGNLSSVITARLSDEGHVGKFGDELKVFPVSKRDGVLSQSEKISAERCEDVGGSTECGIWKFFRRAIDKGEWWDNVFVYSDQQAGHGGLYGDIGRGRYVIGGTDFTYHCRGEYIDVMKLVDFYRRKVNPRMNFFTVQTGGYSNTIMPEFTYRGAVLSGWTGKEAAFAANVIAAWDSAEKQEA